MHIEKSIMVHLNINSSPKRTCITSIQIKKQNSLNSTEDSLLSPFSHCIPLPSPSSVLNMILPDNLNLFHTWIFFKCYLQSELIPISTFISGKYLRDRSKSRVIINQMISSEYSRVGYLCFIL